MRYVSLFTGIGGFDLGFDRAGMSCDFQVEIDDACRKVLERHWPDVPRIADVADVAGTRFPGVDLICGGFPCQDVSVAGDRAGLAGARSGLFFEFMRIVGEMGPTWVVIENVAGLLSSNRGRDMGTVLGTLGDLGYGYAWRVLDSQHFGVPQRRRRIFIVGHSRDWAAPAQVLLESEGVPGDSRASVKAGTLTSALTKSGLGGGGPDDNLAQGGHLIPTLTTRCGSTMDDQQVKQLVPFRKSRRSQGGDNPETWVEDEVSNTLNVFDVGDVRSTQIVAEATGFSVYPEKSNAKALKARETEIATTLTSADRNTTDRGTRVVEEGDDGLGVRRLSPVECERLQGFPDGWTSPPGAEQNDTPRYRQLGNAVTVNVAEWIGRRIMEVECKA